MKLIETTVKFKTKELIESMLDVAQYQGQRANNGGSLSVPYWYYAVHVNLGRQCGHTTALKEIIQERDDDLLIVHNNDRRKEYNTCSSRVRSITHGPDVFRGSRVNTLIFESVAVEEAREFYNRYAYMIRPKAILLVGCY